MSKNKLLKNILIICIVFSLVYSFFGKSNSSNDLDQLAYIMSIGIDVGDIDTYKISFQTSTIYSSSSDLSGEGSSSGGSSGGGGQSSGGSSESKTPSFEVHTIECNSIDSGINIINTYVDKQIDLSHCKLLLLSEEIAKKGISPIIYTLVNKIEIRPDCNLIISEIPDDEFVGTDKPSIQELLPKYYDVTTNTKIESGYTKNITLTDFYTDLKCSACESTAILGTVRNPNKKQTDTNSQSIGIDKASENITSLKKEPIIEILGLAAFKDDKLVGNLSGIETICHFILTNELDTCSISVPSPFETGNTLDLFIALSQKPKTKVIISNGSPFVKTQISLVAKILSFNNNTSNLTSDLINQIEESTKKYLTDQLYQYLYKTSTEFKSDISGLGKFAKKNFVTLQDWDSYNWLSNYSSCSFQVDLDFSIKSGYLLTNE